MRVAIVVGLVLACVVAPAAATRGVDVSTAVYPSDFKCMKGNGYDFAIIRAFQSNGVPDSTAPHTIYNAWDGGMADVDVYFFPCPTCSASAGSQMDSMVSYLQKYNISSRASPPGSFGMVWLDIEGPQYWHSSTSANSAFISDLIAAGKAHGLSVGIYTSYSQWKPITGDAHIASSLPLWYPHYDDNPSFSDFEAFGGWTKPAIKQFKGTTSLCNAGVDENFY